MILTLQEVKDFLKVDYEDEDPFLQDLIGASEQYLKNASEKVFDSTNKLARLYCKVLINEWFKDRSLMQEQKVTARVRFTLQSILLQLQYAEV